MKQLIRRFSRVADSSTATTSFCLLRSERRATTMMRPRRSRSSVPAGHVPVYVGEEMERFAVSADLLNHPVFAKLLNRSAQEYGYQQKGVLHIPCHVSDFERVVSALRSAAGRPVSADLLRLLDSISPPAAADDSFLN